MQKLMSHRRIVAHQSLEHLGGEGDDQYASLADFGDTDGGGRLLSFP